MMLRSNVWSKQITKNTFSLSSLFPILATVIVLLLGGGLGMLVPRIINMLPIADTEKIASRFGTPGSAFWGAIIGTIILAIIIVLRQNELAAAMVVIVIRLYVDWYLGLVVVAQIVTLVLLLIFFLARSSRYPWVEPRALWLWVLFLVLAFFPSTRALNFLDGAYYYSTVIFSALIIFWLGLVVARDIQSLFKVLSFFGALLAVHTIIEATTGVLLLKSTRYDAYLSKIGGYLVESSASRAGSFLVNPDSAGVLFAIMLFFPLSLFIESRSPLGKALYLAEMFLMLPALLFTYSTGAWVAAAVGVVAFLALVGHPSYRVQISLVLLIAAAVVVALFPSQIALQFQHATDPSQLMLRSGAWQTGINVIQAFPIGGLGLGRDVYILRADPYRVPQQYAPLAHPHNSYLELAALGGLPLLAIFLTILFFNLWLALRNWKQTDAHTRSLLAGGVAAITVASLNSLVNPVWTHPALTAIAWLILGVISSPLLAKKQTSEMEQKKNNK